MPDGFPPLRVKASCGSSGLLRARQAMKQLLPVIAAMAIFIAAPDACAQEDRLIVIKKQWDVIYSDLARGQARAAKEWSNSDAKAKALLVVQSETRNLDSLFRAYQLKADKSGHAALLEGITSYCATVRQLEQFRGAFAEVAYVMDLSDTIYMAKYFGRQLDDATVRHECSE